MRERVWGSPDVGRAPGCVRTQGTLPGSIWKRGMWLGVATQVRTHRTHGTQEMRRLRQDATPTDQTQGPFLLMYVRAETTRDYSIVLPNMPRYQEPLPLLLPTESGQTGHCLLG